MSTINFPLATTSLFVNTLNTNKIIYLPAASTIGAGRLFYIKDICGNAARSSIYISMTGMDRIENRFQPSTLYALMSTNYGSVLMAPDGALNWYFLQHYHRNAVTSAILDGFITATGGTITTNGSYKIHTFTTVGANTFTLTSPGSITAQVLVVGGGGSGGSAYAAGGGGAGGAVYNAAFTLTSGTYTLTVGGGGARTGGGVGILGNQGSNSVFSSLTGNGGGGGASYNLSMTAGSGGCGGGSSWGGTAGTGTQGFGGGTSANQQDSIGFNCGGGGGGMGSAGVSPVGTRPNGGAGATYTVGGTSYLVSGGGGAGSDGLGGLGRDGGGLGGNGNQGGNSASNGGDATGYGCGGGGGGGNNSSLYGGAGGPGIVVIAYLTSSVGFSPIANGLRYQFDAAKNLPTTSGWTDANAYSNLTFFNSPPVTSGSVNYVSFNGTSQYASSVDMTNLAVFTITMWIRTTSTTNNGTFYLKPHLIGQGSPGGQSRDFGLTTGGGYAGIWSGIGSGDTQNQSETNTSAANYIANGLWHELTVTSSFANGSRLYVNGTQFGSALAVSQNTESGQNWFIGATNYLAGGPNAWAAADVSVILLYTRELSAVEVSSNFNTYRSRFGR